MFNFFNKFAIWIVYFSVLLLFSTTLYAADSILYVDLSGDGTEIYGLEKDDSNGYETSPVNVYDSNGNKVSLSRDTSKCKLFASVKALDAITNKTFTSYETNLDLGVSAGIFTSTDVLQTIAADSTGFCNLYEIGWSGGSSIVVTAVSLIVDTATEGGSLLLAYKTGLKAIALQKIYLDIAKSIIEQGESNSYISYDQVKLAYLLLRASEALGDTAHAVFKIVKESATVDGEEAFKDLVQANLGTACSYITTGLCSPFTAVASLIGAMWSGWCEGYEAGELLANVTWEIWKLTKEALSLRDDIFALMEDKTSFPANFFFYEPDESLLENQPPVPNFFFNNTRVTIGEAIAVDASDSIDPDGDNFTYKWSIIGPDDSSTTMADDSAVVTQFKPDEPGVYTVKLTLFDGKESSSNSGSVYAEKEEKNEAPTAVIEASDTKVTIGTKITVSGSSSYDVDGDSISGSHTWSLIVPDGSGSELSATTGESVSFTPDTEGSYTSILTVSDGESSSSSRKSIQATDTYPTIEVDIEDDGGRHIYIWDLDVGECQFKSVGAFTVPEGEKWRYIKIAGSKEDIILIARWNEKPEPRDDNWKSMCQSGYNIDDRFKGTELSFRDSTEIYKFDTGDRYPGETLYIYAYSPDGEEGGGVSGYSVNSIVRVSYDLDDDGVPDYEEDEACLNNSKESFDSDGDGVCNNEDQFDNDPAAYLDDDGDGYPDTWISGYSESDSITGLTLDLFTNNSSEWIDSDSDGIGDNEDQFDDDAAASVDTDGDGYPDAWNDGKSEEDSTTGLTLDKFIDDAAAVIDNDDDGHPGRWNIDKTESDSTTGLTIDRFDDDPLEWADTDLDGVGDNSDWAPEDLTEWADTDGDGVGDNADVAPNDPERWKNTAPVFVDIDELSVNQGQSMTLSLVVTDSDGDEITYSLIRAQEFIRLEENVLEISAALTTDPGEYAIIVKAADGFGGTDFFNITLTVVADADGDGLSDELEALMGTASDDKDTDDDGIPDGSEDSNHNGIVDEGETNPLSIDTDGDGIQDGTESGLSSDDISSDTDTSVFIPDNDGSIDTDPTLADSDGDGLSDGLEDYNQNGSIDSCEPDPSIQTVTVTVDMDNDGDVDGTDLFTFVTSLSDDSFDGCMNIVSGYLGYTDFPSDPDNDGILSDGDYSGIKGDTPCVNGVMTDCDDNCPDTYNPDQADSDGDGVGDACDSSQHFAVTTGKYGIYDNLDDICKSTFGHEYRIADWNDIVAYYNAGADPDDIMGTSTQTVHAFVTRNGSHFWSGDRHYIASRNNHSPHSGYLSHANIDNHLFDLGSWYSDYCILCYEE